MQDVFHQQYVHVNESTINLPIFDLLKMYFSIDSDGVFFVRLLAVHFPGVIQLLILGVSNTEKVWQP